MAYGAAGLGYVDAMHQSLRQGGGATVLTSYLALPTDQRAALLQAPAQTWAERVQRIDLARHGHAMAMPRPGVRSSTALAALRAGRGRARYAHGDLAGYSVFEEAFTLGHQAAAWRTAIS